MAIKQLKEPIYEKQEGETPRQYYYFREFCLHKGTLEEFVTKMESRWNQGEDTDLKYKPYTRSSFVSYSAANFWTERKEAKEVSEIDDMFARMEQIDRDSKVKKFELQSKARTRNLELLNRRLESGEIKGSQIEAHSKANKNFQDAERTDLEKATEIIDNKHNIDASIDSTVDVNPSIADKILLPEYTEITRKVMDAIVEDMEESSDE